MEEVSPTFLPSPSLNTRRGSGRKIANKRTERLVFFFFFSRLIKKAFPSFSSAIIPDLEKILRA